MVSRAVDRLSRAWKRGRTEARDALELLLLPGLAALLPWRAAFWLFKRMAGWAWLYRGQCERGLAGARSHGRVDDAARWLRLLNEAGLISRLLPDWSSPEIDVHAVYPTRRFLPAKLQVFLEALKAWKSPLWIPLR